MMAGAEGFEAEDQANVAQLIGLLRKLVQSGQYAVLILPERFVEPTQELRSRLMREGKITPVFEFVPDYTGVKGKKAEELRRSINLAVGAELTL